MNFYEALDRIYPINIYIYILPSHDKGQPHLTLLHPRRWSFTPTPAQRSRGSSKFSLRRTSLCWCRGKTDRGQQPTGEMHRESELSSHMTSAFPACWRWLVVELLHP